MKQFRLGTFIALVMLFCLGLHKGHAQTSPTTTSYTAVVSTPSGPSDPPAGPSFLYFGSTATLKPVGQPGELTAGNIRYKWTAKMKQWQSGSGFTASNAPTDFLDASSPPDNTDTSTQNPTILRTVLATSGYYQLTLSVTITYDMVDSNGNGQTNLTANGSATCQIEVAVPDFSMSGGTSVTVPLDSSTSVTITASPINDFYGTIQLSLTAGNPNAGQSTNPSGVTLGSGSSDSSLSISLFGTQGNYPLTARDGSSSTTTTVNVAGNATPAPGGTPLIVYGDGSDNGPPIEHSTVFNLTIPTRSVEIDGPYDSNNSKANDGSQHVPQRAADHSITVDSVVDYNSDYSVWQDQNNYTAKATGFATTQSYTWNIAGGMDNVGTGNRLGQPSDNFATTNNNSDLENLLLWSHQQFSNSGGPPTTQFPASSTITVGVKNVSGSLTTSTSYTINWHYPGENYQPYGQPIPNSLEIDASSTQNGDPAIANGTIHCTFDPFGQYYIAVVQNGAAQTFSVASNFAKPPYSSLLAALGLASSSMDLGTHTYTDDTNSFSAWQEAVALTKAGNTHVPAGFAYVANQTAAWQQCQMTAPVISAHYVDQYYAGDAYDHTGYLGPNRKDYKAFRKQTSMIATGTYTKL